MRVALVHSFYASGAPSGENVVVTQEAEALSRAGHDVHVIALATDDLVSERLYRTRAGYRVATGRGRSPLRALSKLDVDVVHVHNLFPNYGTRWVSSSPAPVVHTAHNFRSLCAPGTFYRDGHDCRACVSGRPWAGVQHGCYRESRVQTLPLALANRSGLARHPVFGASRRVVVMSDQAREIFVSNGLHPDRLVVKPHFVSDEVAPSADFAAQARHTGPWLFAGNLLPQKGILELLQRWPAGHPLVVVGDGPLRPAVDELATEDVQVIGALPRKQVLELMADARGLVFPSRWLETFGMVYAEAMACGLPVLAFEGNVVAEQVRKHGTGRVIGWEDDLGLAVREAEDLFPARTRTCRDHFDTSYTESAHVAQIIRIYQQALGE